jgi:hypothetical protein
MTLVVGAEYSQDTISAHHLSPKMNTDPISRGIGVIGADEDYNEAS